MIVEASYIPVVEDYNKDSTLKLSAILKILENALLRRRLGMKLDRMLTVIAFSIKVCLWHRTR